MHGGAELALCRSLIPSSDIIFRLFKFPFTVGVSVNSTHIPCLTLWANDLPSAAIDHVSCNEMLNHTTETECWYPPQDI